MRKSRETLVTKLRTGIWLESFQTFGNGMFSQGGLFSCCHHDGTIIKSYQIKKCHVPVQLEHVQTLSRAEPCVCSGQKKWKTGQPEACNAKSATISSMPEIHATFVRPCFFLPLGFPGSPPKNARKTKYGKTQTKPPSHHPARGDQGVEGGIARVKNSRWMTRAKSGTVSTSHASRLF